MGIFLKMFFRLSFLKTSEVCFTGDIMKLQSNSNRIHEFCDYFLSTYVRPNSLFLPAL